MSKEIFPLSRKHDLVDQTLNGEVLIYDLQTNRAFCLNETSMLVWQLCDGTRSIAELSRLTTEKLKQFVPEDVIWLALDALKRNNLLDADREIKIDFRGFSRREIVRRAGLATLVALPVISFLVAPAAANAQSGGLAALCQACTPANGCTTGTCRPDYNDGSRAYCAINPFPATFAVGENAGCGGSESACLDTLGPGYCCSGTASYNPMTTCCTCTSN